MVTGAVIALQGIAKADSDLIGSLEMRALLRSTGTPQGTSNRKIGAMPNLAYALVRYFKSDGNLLVNPGFEPDASGWKVILTQNDGNLKVLGRGELNVGLSAQRPTHYPVSPNADQPDLGKPRTVTSPGNHTPPPMTR